MARMPGFSLHGTIAAGFALMRVVGGSERKPAHGVAKPAAS